MKKINGAQLVILIIIAAMLCFCGTEYLEEKDKIKQVANNNEENDEQPILEEILIYFFDVGQADSIFVKIGGKNMLIDAGNNKDGELICDYLNSINVEKIDYLIGTHPHEDHIGGLDDIINSFEIGALYMPKKSTTTKTFTDVLDAVESKNIKVKAPNVGDTFNLGSAVCKIMAIDNEAKEINQSSIVVMMTYGEQKFLFTGDIEAENEEARTWEDIDVLKVAHHGSKTSSTTEFLNETKPEIAIISLGKDNSYGFPHDVILERLNKVSAKVYRTDEKGTILISSDGEKNEVTYLDLNLDGD